MTSPTPTWVSIAVLGGWAKGRPEIPQEDPAEGVVGARLPDVVKGWAGASGPGREGRLGSVQPGPQRRKLHWDGASESQFNDCREQDGW